MSPEPTLTATPLNSRITVLLIDDQLLIGEAVRFMLEDETDIQFHFCREPARAVELANTVRPTVILQDLVMPDIDGLELVKLFRANPGTCEVPLIVLSSKEEPLIKAEAFALGANDYLVKLPDPVELIARIRYHSRGYIHMLERNEAYRQLEIHMQERNEAYRQLEISQNLLATEVAQAARYVQSLLPEPLSGEVSIDWRFVPSTQLGGDMFGYHWVDPDHLVIYLLDVTGHGVGASLLAASAANLLSAESLPDTDFRAPAKVAAHLNDVFQMEKHDQRYFTIWYGVYQRRERRLMYCNCGHPPALLFTGPTPEAATMRQLGTTGPGIGMLPPGLPFRSREVHLDSFARLLLFSDGVYEIPRLDGTMGGPEDFLAHVSHLTTQEKVLDDLLAHARQLGGSNVLEDDFSILEVRFPPRA